MSQLPITLNPFIAFSKSTKLNLILRKKMSIINKTARSIINKAARRKKLKLSMWMAMKVKSRNRNNLFYLRKMKISP